MVLFLLSFFNRRWFRTADTVRNLKVVVVDDEDAPVDIINGVRQVIELVVLTDDLFERVDHLFLVGLKVELRMLRVPFLVVNLVNFNVVQHQAVSKRNFHVKPRQNNQWHCSVIKLIVFLKTKQDVEHNCQDNVSND